MATFMYVQSLGRAGEEMDGYRYNGATANSVVIRDAFRLMGGFVLFDEATNMAQYGLYLSNTGQGASGVVLPHGIFDWQTGTDGSGGGFVAHQIAVQNPLASGATFTRLTNNRTSVGDIDHQYTWEQSTGPIQNDDGTEIEVGRNGIWGSNALANSNLGSGVIKVAHAVHDRVSGDLKGYLKAVNINGNDSTNGWGPQDSLTRCLVLDLFGADGAGDVREPVPLIWGVPDDLSHVADPNIGPTLMTFRPKGG